MQTEQIHWESECAKPASPPTLTDADLVYVFGPPDIVNNKSDLSKINTCYPVAIVAGCSTAGDIWNHGISDHKIITTAMKFDSTRVRAFYANISNPEDSFATGLALAQQARADDLRHLFILSDGIHVNGAQLTRGITQGVAQGIPVSGGLAADSDRFRKTYVIGPTGPQENLVCVMAFYGRNFTVHSGSVGGWDSFGPERTVTRAVGPVVFELDGKPILDLYKKFLGEYAAELPGSALLFPLNLRGKANEKDVVRTILGVDEKERSMQFAGDIQQGTRVRLMKANLSRLIDGAGNAAHEAGTGLNSNAAFAMLISCVGRRLVLKQRSEEEITAAREAFSPNTCFTGFYSYGEISTSKGFTGCDFHNQTMTITAYAEN